jgi:prevent-host-death family protein
MVITGHNVTMKKVGVAELKAHLSAHLKAVRQGRTLVVVHRDMPVARIVPYEAEAHALKARPPLRRLHSAAMPPPVEPPPDSLSALLEERKDRL